MNFSFGQVLHENWLDEGRKVYRNRLRVEAHGMDEFLLITNRRRQLAGQQVSLVARLPRRSQKVWFP